MAEPLSEQILPPLEACLKGEVVLLSWKLLASALSDTNGHRQTSQAVVDFLCDPQVLEYFTKSPKAFEPLPKDPASAKDAYQRHFETRTAAIQVTPTPNDKYDIKIIKEDAQWLSSNARINLIAALRVVVAEFQSRPLDQLNGPLSIQDAASLQEAAGATSAQASNVLPGLNISATRDASDIQAEFEKPASRRRRIFQTYLSERRYFAMSADCLFTLMLQGQLPTSPASEATDKIRKSLLQAFGMKAQHRAPLEAPTKTCFALVAKAFELLPGSVSSADAGLASITTDEVLLVDELQGEWAATFLTEALHSMSIAFQLLDLSSSSLAPPALIKQWFKFVADFGFLDYLQPVEGVVPGLVAPIQTLVCVITLSLINLPRIIAYFEGDADVDTDAEYIGASDALELIHETILAAANAGLSCAIPVMFAWSLMLGSMHSSYQERAEKRDTIQNQKAVETYDSGTQLQPGSGRRNSGGSITTIDRRGYDDFLISAQVDRDVQLARGLADAATNGGVVYDIISSIASRLGPSQDAMFAAQLGSRMRIVLLELLKATYQVVEYLGPAVESLLVVLSGSENYWDISTTQDLPSHHQVLDRALADEMFLVHYFGQALSRFPYEFLPFVSLCRILSHALRNRGENHDLILRLLQKTPSITLILPSDIRYELSNEEDNTNSMRLLEDLPLFLVTAARKRITAEAEPFTIPAGTSGRFLIEGGDIVLMEHPHSALSLLGKRLDANLNADMYQLGLGMLDADDTAEVIALLATLLRAEVVKSSAGSRSTQPSEAGLLLLAEASRALPRTKDIVSIVTDTFDTYLDQDADASQIAVLSACLEFLHAVLPLCPGRVWSYMSRCAVLGTEARGGKLSSLVGSLDLPDNRVGFLLAAIRLFSALVESAMTSSVQRKAATKSNIRQKSTESAWLGVSDKIISQICFSIGRTSIDIFENSSTWRFSSEMYRTSLIRDLVPIMDKLITYTYGMDDTMSNKTLTGPLERAAKAIIDSFLAPSAGTLRIQPLLVTLVAACESQGSTIYPYKQKALNDRTIAVVSLATTLVRVANFFDKASTTIEKHLFKAIPFIARVAASSNALKIPAVSLLEALVISAGKSSGEPPSLLGYLGVHAARSFLELLSTLDRPFDQADEVTAVWRFFSTIVRNRQQWVANCLLTGKTPRAARGESGKSSPAASNSVLASAQERLTSISKLDSTEALAILDFITSAQNFWPWTIFALQKNSNFLVELRRYVRELKPASLTSKTNSLQACHDARSAAYIAEIFAMQLFHLRQMGHAEAFAKELAQDLDYFLRSGVEVSGYNNSLHANFSKNFTNQYPGCKLENFKRTLLQPRSLGTEFYYALDYADRMLEFSPGWIGPKNNGFKSEMEMANTNLSLVDAQLALFHAWEFLLLELSTCLPDNTALKKQSLQVAEQCLEANHNIQGPEQIFERLAESRVNLALLLVQRVVDNTPSPGDVAQLLTTLWGTVSSVEDPYIPENITLYRTLLKLLYVTLRAQIRAFSQNSKSVTDGKQVADSAALISQTLLSIIDRTVAEGFRTLVALIHDSNTSIGPEDVAMLTAILQACLCLPGMDQNQTQILNIMAAHDAVHVAVSLYSWADKLADKGDPVYGELALLFLLELSTLPLVAEQLACDGVLNHITSASMAGHLQRPNVSPFADAAGPQRCYSIWAKAIVPLLLNILTALGPTIASEVANVLNLFPHLLAASVERLEAPGASRTQTGPAAHRNYVTLLAVSEVQSLALMVRVLAALRANNARDMPEVMWDAAGLLENVEFWLGATKILKDRLVPLGPREAEWKALKPSEPARARGIESKLEEKVVEQLEAVRLVLSEELQ